MGLESRQRRSGSTLKLLPVGEIATYRNNDRKVDHAVSQDDLGQVFFTTLPPGEDAHVRGEAKDQTVERCSIGTESGVDPVV